MYISFYLFIFGVFEHDFLLEGCVQSYNFSDRKFRLGGASAIEVIFFF